MTNQGWSRDAVVVVGGGLSGVAFSRELVHAGIQVVVLDRGRRPGGRMAIRTVRTADGEHVVDVGASYLVARDESFVAVVEDWQQRGLAHPWTDTFATLGAGGSGTTTGPVRWSAAHGLVSLVVDLARDLDVRRHTVGAVDQRAAGPVVDGHAARAVVLAMPDPQAQHLLGNALPSQHAAVAERGWDPVLALWASWSTRWWPQVDAVFVNDSPVLSFVADDGRRRGDGAAVLVAHTSPEFASQHLDDPDSAMSPVLDELERLLGNGSRAPRPERVGVQRWTYARPSTGRAEPFGLGAEPVGICGDGWGPRPGVEQAWLSGHRLGRALAERLTG